MVSVPTYQPTQRDRPAAQTPFRNSATPESFGAGVGRALQDAGQASQTVAAALTARSMLEDDTRTREQKELLRGDHREILIDPEGGYYNKTGTNALGDAYESAADRMEKARQKRASELTGGAKEKFLSETADMTHDQLDGMAKHAAKSSREGAVEGYEASITGYREDALLYWKDETLFEKNLQRAVDEQAELAALTGKTGEVLDLANRQLISETIRQRAILMADDAPGAAEQYINDNKERLTAEHLYELDTNFEPLVRAEKARGVVSKHLHQGGGLDATTRRESGGKAGAKNPDSTALGPSQMLSGTYLQMVSRLQQQGKGGLWDGMSREEILATRGDPSGKYDRAARAEYDRLSYKALDGSGFKRSNSNMYALHHFGQAGGLTLLEQARKNPAATPEEVWAAAGYGSWAEIRRVNPWIKPGMSVGDVVRQMRETQGEGTYLGMGGAPRFDATSAYAEAQLIEDPELQAEVVKQIEAQEALQNKQLNAASSAASEQAYNDYVAGGDGELSTNQRLALGPTGVAAWDSFVHADKTGNVVTDMATYEMVRNLEAMATSGSRKDMEDFAETNLHQYAGQLDRGVLANMLASQAQTRAALAGEQMTAEQIKKNPEALVKVTPEIRTQIKDTYERVSGKKADKNKEAVYQMEEVLRRQMKALAEENLRGANDQEVYDMLTAQALKVAVDNKLIVPGLKTPLSSGFAFQAPYTEVPGRKPTEVLAELEDVPTYEREEIARTLEAVLGRVPTNDEVVRAYEDKTLAKGYMSTQAYSIEEIPPAEVQYSREVLGLSDAEIELQWQLYMEGVLTGAVDPREARR